MFHLHEIITAKVHEVLSLEEFILSYKGKLFRVFDKSSQIHALGQEVDLVVIALNPVKFRVKESQKDKNRGRLNISI